MKLIFKTLSLSLVLSLFIISFLTYYPAVAAALGFNSEPVGVSGTGSMYPTFPKGKAKTVEEQFSETVEVVLMRRYFPGIEIFGKKFLESQINRGDIVSFENEKTRSSTKKTYGQEAGYIKRVVAVAGDKISVRDGFLFLNGSLLLEPYTAAARSTFGEEFLTDCQEFEVQKDFVFVLGDNRKGSLDSRAIGPIALKSIDHVLPFKDQTHLAANWRDPSKDKESKNKITLSEKTYYEILNQKRREKDLKNLNPSNKLENSSLKRADAIINFNDFSTDAQKSHYSLKESLADAGYNNVITSEIIINGYYSEEELVEGLLENPKVAANIFDKDFQEIGLAAEIGKINGCETQIIVVHFGGFVPPNYSAKEVDSWRNSITSIRESLPIWKTLLDQKAVDQNDLQKLLNNYNEELAIAVKISSKLEGNLWLSQEDQNEIKRFESLVVANNAIADKINSQIIDWNKKIKQ